MIWPYVLMGLLSIINFLVGFYVFLKNSLRPLNRAFFIFSIGMAIIEMGMVLLLITHYIIFDRFIFVGGYLMVFGLVILSMKFPEDKPLHPSAWLIFLPLAALMAVTPSGIFVKEVIFRSDGILEPVNGPGIQVFAVIIGAYIFFSGWKFKKKYKTLSGVALLQMQYLVLGAGIFVISIFIFNVFLPAVGIFDLNIIGPISSIAFVGAVAYAIVRHRLLDVRIAIQRGAIYFGLIVVVVCFYLILIFVISFWFQSVVNRQDVVFLGIGLLTTCVGIFTVPYLEVYFRKITDKLFFKDKYNYPKAIHDLSAILNESMERKKIVKRTSRALGDILRTTEARIFLFGDRSNPGMKSPWYLLARTVAFRQKRALILGRWATKDKNDVGEQLRSLYGIEVVAPIFLGRKPLGIIVLGPKKSGDPYRDEDVELLTTFSYQAAVALEKGRLFEKLKNYSGVLEERVRKRTAELIKLQDEQHQMMIDISHRLQTPLTTIKSELDFLKRQSNPPEHLNTFERSIDGISKFIYDLLDLARLGIKKNDSLGERVNLSNLLLELVEYFGVMAEEGNINLGSRIEPNIHILGNKDNLEELVMNLTSNAFKYLDITRVGKISIALYSSGDRAIFEIVDNGRGIAPEDLKRIFERFYRGKQFGVDIAGGTGLGLAIAKRIAENHGGVIDIESALGQGTKVTVVMPLLDDIS